MKQTIPSETAIQVALSLITLNAQRRARKILPAGIATATEQLLLAAGVADQRRIRLAKSPWTVGMSMAANPWTLGQIAAFAERKAFCQQVTLKAIAAGASQVLVLGAGFDTLCWRLAPANPKTCFIEIDHPATALAKQAGMKKLNQPKNMTLIAADLGIQSLSEILAETSQWQVSEHSIIIAEGLLMYLSSEAVIGLFENAASVVSQGSQFAFSHFLARRNGQPDLGPFGDFALAGLRMLGEPIGWSIRRGDLAEFVQPVGWQIVTDTKQSRGAGIEGYAVLERS